MDKVRCTVCRGAKQVVKLGGMMGNCNLCKGEGEINRCDVPVIKPVVVEPVSSEVIKQVANVAPVSKESEVLEVPKDVDVKIDGKRAIYKRKTVAK
jgi:hypothetical protein